MDVLVEKDILMMGKTKFANNVSLYVKLVWIKFHVLHARII